MVALIPRNPNVVVQGYDGAEWLTEMPDKMNKNIKLKEMEHIKYLDQKKKVYSFKSKLEQMEIGYSNNEAKKCCQKVIV